MDELLKGLTGGGQGQTGQGQSGQGGGIGDLLGGLLGGGGLGSGLGAGGGAGAGNPMGGGMGSMLGGGLGAMLPALLGMLGGKSGADNGSGVHQLVDTMHAKGMGDVVGSWVGTGANQPITAAQVEQVMDPEQLAQLAAQSGLPREQVSEGVAAVLPHVVSTLTPDGTLPDHAQVKATTDQLQAALAGLVPGKP